MKSTTTEEECANCHSRAIITDEDAGDIVCRVCGTVKDERITEKSMSSLKEGGMISRRSVSVIAFHDKDASRKPFSAQAQKNAQRLRLWDKRSPKTKIDGRLDTQIPYLESMCSKLGLGEMVAYEATMHLQKVLEMNHARGYGKRAIILALIYISSQKGDAVKTLAEIVRVSGEKKKEISKAHRVLCKTLSINSSVPSRSQIIPRTANELKLPEKISREAVSIYEKMIDRKLTGGKNPHSIAAVCIALACWGNGLSLSRQDIADTIGITRTTLSKGVQELKELIL